MNNMMLGADNEHGRVGNKRRENFVKLANKRVNRAIKDLRLIGNLANRNVYEYSDAEARKLIKALQKEVNSLKSRFHHTTSDDSGVFKI